MTPRPERRGSHLRYDRARCKTIATLSLSQVRSNPFPERERELKTWISEDAGPAASIDALMSITAYCGLDAEDAFQILAGVERAVANWRSVGRELGMSQVELEQLLIVDADNAGLNVSKG